MPLLKRRLSPQEIDSLISYGVKPETARLLGEDPDALQTLDRDSDPIGGLPPEVPAPDANLLGAPSASPQVSLAVSVPPNTSGYDFNDVIAHPPPPPESKSVVDPYTGKAPPVMPPDPPAHPFSNVDVDAPIKRPEVKPVAVEGVPGAKVSIPKDSAGMVDGTPAANYTPPPKAMAFGVGDSANVSFEVAEQKDPDQSQARATAGAAQQAAAANANALKKWKQEFQENWKQYQDKPIEEQIKLIEKQGQLDKQLADELYQGSTMATAIASAAKQRDADLAAKDADAHYKKLEDLEMKNQEVMNTKLDPGRYWSSKSQLQKVGLTIGTILGGLGGSHGRVRQLINQDIALQQQEIDNKRKGIADARGILADQYKILGDKKAAREAATINLIDTVKTQVELISKKYGGEQAKMRADALILDLEKQRADGYFKLYQYMNPDPRRPVGGGGVATSKALEFKADHSFTLPDGTVAYANDVKEAGELRAATAALSTLDSKAAEVERLSQDPMAYIDGRLESAQMDLALSAKTAGMNSDKDFETLKQKMGVSGSKLVYGAKQIVGLNQGIKQAVEQAKTDYQNKVRAANGTVVQTGFARDPRTGLPTRIAIQTGQTTGDYGATAKPNNSPVKPGAAPTKK